MNEHKHICELNYCGSHGQCIFTNAEAGLKTDAHWVSLANETNGGTLQCYRKEGITLEKEKKVKYNTIVNTVFHKECLNPNCGSMLNLTKHHLFPKGYRRGHARTSEEDQRRTMCLCRDCHTLLHKLKSNGDLGLYYNTVIAVARLLEANTMKLDYKMITIRQEAERYSVAV